MSYITGLELSEKYFEEYGKSIIENHKDIEHLLCAGLFGSGSECLGFDDEISRDHDFEPGFCLFIPDEDILDRRTAFLLEREYSKLPNEFMGFNRNRMSPVGGSRHGIIRTGEFFRKLIGKEDGNLDISDWLTLPQSSLCEATNGKIYFDNFMEVSNIRERLLSMPEDIRKKRLASNLLIMAQSGQYNYDRCIRHSEDEAAQYSVFEFVKSTLEVVFLLNRKYMPYYKWSFKALRSLPKLSDIEKKLSYIMMSNNDIDKQEDKYMTIEDIATQIIGELIMQDLTRANCGDLEKHAYSVNDSIEDSEVRNLNILCCV